MWPSASSSSQPMWGTPQNTNNQQQGQQQYGTPGNNSNNQGFNTFNASRSSYSSYTHQQAPQQNLYSTLSSSSGNLQSPSTLQQQQQQPGQSGFAQQNGYTGNSSMGGQGQQQQYISPGMSSFGQSGPQQQQQYGGQQGQHGQPQFSQQGQASAAPKYMVGYLTAAHQQHSSPKPSTNNPSASSYEGRASSPDHSLHRDSYSESKAPSRLFSSTTSSSGTGGGRESPSRSPKQSLFSISSTRQPTSYRNRRNSAYSSESRGFSGNQHSAGGEYGSMDQDAPPVESLGDDEDEYGYGASPPTLGSNASALVATNGSSSQQNGASPQPASRSLLQPSGNSAASSSAPTAFKVTVFGFPTSLQTSVLSSFSNIAPIIYNSLSPNSSNSKDTGAEQPAGANWVTIGYEHEWAALRALRRNGEVLGGNLMIGVKTADGALPTSLVSSAPTGFLALPSTASASNGESSQPPTTTTTLGQPIPVLPASQAWLANKKPAGPAALTGTPGGKNGTSRLAELGRFDPKAAQAQASEQKQGGGVVSTISNLIFGF